jgi:hypothetical protein
MNLKEVIDIVDGELLVDAPVDIDILNACCSDLMSDVLMFVKPNMLLVTGLTNPQAVRTADMAEAPIIVFVRGTLRPVCVDLVNCQSSVNDEKSFHAS